MWRRCISWGNTVGGCTHPLVSIFSHRPRVWISLYRLLPLPWKVPIIPHSHVSSRVTLLTVLLFMWGFHFLSIQNTGKCNPVVEIGPHKNNIETILQHCFFFFFFFNSEIKLRKNDCKMIKGNSPRLVMRITSVPQLLTCTKAPSPATTPFDSCHSRVIRNQQNLYPKFLLLS